MKASRNAALGSLALMLAAAGTAGAQGKCEINTNKPSQVQSAQLALTKAEFGKPEQNVEQVRGAVKSLTENPEKINNPVGRSYVLSQALVWWMTKGNAAPVAKRGDLGYAVDPNGTIDVAAALDTAFRAIEAGAPNCASEVEQLRRNAWVPVITSAGNYINANQLDSARAAMSRAQILLPNSPITTYYSGVVAQNSQDAAAARSWYKKTVDLLTPQVIAQDTSLANVRAGAMYSGAYMALVEAEKAPEAEQKAKMNEAAAGFQAYLKEYPNGENVVQARSGLARAAQAAGDTAAVTSLYSEMVADPAKYTDMQLFEGGAAAFNADRKQDAAKLFEAGLEKNPYYRDGLYNLVNTYLALKDPRMLDAARRLVAVDPNNPENWRLLAAAHQLPAKKIEEEYKTVSKDPKKSARAAQLRAQMKAVNDSVLKYYSEFEKAPARVSFNLFSHDGAKHALGGTIENLTDKPASYTMKVEFLDAKGNVVTTGETKVDAAAKETKPFRVEANGQGIVAFRYAPLI
ncbi:MAG TPA: hypothetical protein VFS05_04445 [Gemmatimonadaceae bacterium]|nr:hypothetical protein [Gemmatimonadaceae bacterium]